MGRCLKNIENHWFWLNIKELGLGIRFQV